MSNFIKQSYKDNDCFLKEADDLRLLEKHLNSEYIKIPDIINVDKNCLELQRIYCEKPTKELMQKLGIGLAKLHQIQFENYGFEEHNFIGLNIQKNEFCDNWGEFFVQNRLYYQVSLIKIVSIRNQLENILHEKRSAIVNFLNSHCAHPSLVHGDLWSGNVLFDKKDVWFIDPSSYYADREVDIAMSELFLGFDKEFYDAYNKTYALSSVYEEKKIIYNLYHNLNHYNLFGHSYLSACEKGFDFLKTL